MNNFESIGKTNDAVLPVPVCAAAIMSLLFKPAGITSAWIGVGIL